MLQGLISAARDHKIRLRVVNNIEESPSNDIVDLVNAGICHVVHINVICERCFAIFSMLFIIL